MRFCVSASFAVGACVLLAGCSLCVSKKKMQLAEYESMFQQSFTTFDDIIKLFPKTVEQVDAYKECAIEKAKKDLDAVKQVASGDRTFANTIGALDTLQAHFSTTAGIIRTLEMVSPDKAVREKSHAAAMELNTFAVDAFMNKDLYRACKVYIDSNQHNKETLSPEQHYVLTETMKDFKRAGFDLSDDVFSEVKALQEKLSNLELAFESAIANDTSCIIARREDLEGLKDEFVEQLERDGQNYKLACDYPTYTEVMNHCSVEQTRKKLYRAFNNRAYPANVSILNDIIKERDALAKILGFESYAALNFEGLMARTVGRVKDFTIKLAKLANRKASQEFQTFSQELPEGIQLVDKKFKPWDVGFVKTAYKKKHFDIDDRVIAEYFEMEPTLKAIFTIYQQFLGLKFFITKPAWSWHEDVRLIEVYDVHSGVLRGYVILDLYPRACKYSHACWMPLIAARKEKQTDGTWRYAPAVGVMIANFPKATSKKPALLKHHDVETFFHEFGHAMHSILGATQHAGTSGTSVKRDFVEVPSQMFEEWMSAPEVLRSIGSHYVTHKPLSDELIAKIIGLKKFDSGAFVVRQCSLSLLAMDLFCKGGCKNVDALLRRLHEEWSSHTVFDEECHFYASFGHLAGYGAAYYSYMWSKVFALDLFYAVKERGLNDAAVGKKFVEAVLSRGGSVEPDELLKDFLGREPNQKAFAQDLGLEN